MLNFVRTGVGGKDDRWEKGEQRKEKDDKG